MKVDLERLRKYSMVIQKSVADMEQLLTMCSDKEILADWIKIAALKYLLIELAEATANVLQHLLARVKGEAVESYVGLIEKAESVQLLPADVLEPLKPFFRFGSVLIHRYWEIDDRRLVLHCRKGLRDFRVFVSAIEEKFVSCSANGPSIEPF